MFKLFEKEKLKTFYIDNYKFDIAPIELIGHITDLTVTASTLSTLGHYVDAPTILTFHNVTFKTNNDV